METPSLEGFVRFVQDQPDERPIDQECFHTCACGDYMAHLGLDRRQGEEFYDCYISPIEEECDFDVISINMCLDYRTAKEIVSQYPIKEAT